MSSGVALPCKSRCTVLPPTVVGAQPGLNPGVCSSHAHPQCRQTTVIWRPGRLQPAYSTLIRGCLTAALFSSEGTGQHDHAPSSAKHLPTQTVDSGLPRPFHHPHCAQRSLHIRWHSCIAARTPGRQKCWRRRIACTGLLTVKPRQDGGPGLLLGGERMYGTCALYVPCMSPPDLQLTVQRLR